MQRKKPFPYGVMNALKYKLRKKKFFFSWPPMKFAKHKLPRLAEANDG